MSKQHVNIKSTSNLTLKQRCFGVDFKKVLLLCYDAQEVKIFTLTLKRSAFERQNFIISSTRQNLMLKQ